MELNSSLNNPPNNQKPQKQENKLPAILDESTFVGSIFTNIVYPKLKDLAYSTITSTAEKYIYGSISTKNLLNKGNSLYSYDRHTAKTIVGESPMDKIVYSRPDKYRANTNQREWGRGMNLDMADIQNITNQMQYCIDASGILTVADMYDIFKIGDAPHVANNIGWTTLDGAQSKNDMDNMQYRYIYMPPPHDIRGV